MSSLKLSIIVPSGAPDESTNTPGVARTLTFKVLTSGESNLNLSPSDTGVAYMKYPDGRGGNSHDVTPVTTDQCNIQPSIFTTISLYNSGTMNSTIQFQNGQASQINQIFHVDIYMNNMKSEPVWAWNTGITWNRSSSTTSERHRRIIPIYKHRLS